MAGNMNIQQKPHFYILWLVSEKDDFMSHNCFVGIMLCHLRENYENFLDKIPK